jgi:hypothetical protein
LRFPVGRFSLLMQLAQIGWEVGRIARLFGSQLESIFILG